MTSEERRQARYERRKKAREIARQNKIAKYNDFEKVFTFANMWRSARKCYRGVGWKASTQRYRNNAFREVVRLMKKLAAGKYKSRGFYRFVKFERGKMREIKSVHISERNVQKCLCDYCLIPIFAPTLIRDNSATIKGRGTDDAKDRLEKHLKEAFRQYGSDVRVAVFDFKGYFENIDHEILFIIVRGRLTDEKLFALFKHFIDCFGAKGLGLGSQVSQIAAVILPNDIDHYFKDVLAVKGYAHYMDDGYIVAPSKGLAQDYLSIFKMKCERYRIKLNAKKTQIVKASRGVPFLKHNFISTPMGKVVRVPFKPSGRKMKSKIKSFSCKIEAGTMTVNDARASFESWRSHLKDSNAHKFLYKIGKFFKTKILKKEKKEMAVIEQYPYIDDDGTEHPDLVKHYSDEGKQIVKEGTFDVYDEAVDKYPCKYIYAEVEEIPETVELEDKLEEEEPTAPDAAPETTAADDTENNQGFASNTLKALFDN